MRAYSEKVKATLDRMGFLLYYGGYTEQPAEGRREADAVKMSFGEQMRVIMKRRGVSVQELADRLGKSRQNINQRLNSSGFTEKEMEDYTAAIGCTVSIEIIEPPEGGGK